MKRPQDIPYIADFLCWLAWLATMLGAMAGAADTYASRRPARRDEPEPETVDAEATPVSRIGNNRGRRGDGGAT